tara:strand:+ start:364 stop:2742 length:2379 start_codon:yes stop_codon:yes gene_type:complete
MEKLRSLSSVLDEIAEQFVDGVVSEKVGEPTGKKTTAGRSKIKTPKGETVSEKSVTLKLGDKYYNLPSIYGNKRYSDDVLRKALQDGVIQPTSVHDSNEQAKEAAIKRSKGLDQGGAVMQEQMNMAFMQEGGMQDDGGETEPKSGNKVPSGSLKEEVADDIPTMLSEGEFVFPADVVRYIGLETLMKMRQDAKQGLKMMEKMGQLGNPEEAEIPDDIPFGMADLVVISGEMKKEDDEKEEKAEGGAVGLQEGGMPPKRPDPEFYESDAYKMYQDEKDVAYAQVMTAASDGTMLGDPGLARAYDEYLKTKKSKTPTDTGGGGLFDDPRFKRGDGQSPTEYTEEEKKEIQESLKTAPTRGDVTLKKIVNPNNPDDFEMHPFEGDEPMFPLPEGYVVDDTPTEDMYRPRQRTSITTGDSGGGEGLAPLQAPQVTSLLDPRDEDIAKATKQVTASLDGETLYDKNGRPLTLQQQTLNQFKTELAEINKIEGVDLSFKDYYNLPTRDKVYFSLQAKLGQPPSKEQVQNAIKQAKSPTGLRGILSPITTLISTMISSQAYSKDEVDIDTEFADQQLKIETAQDNLNKLIDPRADSPYGKTGVVTNKEYQEYLDDAQLASGARFKSTGMMGKADDFLLGIKRDPRKPDAPAQVFTGKTRDNPSGFSDLTADALGRIEKNRQEVSDRVQQNVLTRGKTAVETSPGNFMYLPSQASGDSEAQQRARDENPLEAALSQNPAYQSQEELANPFRSKGGISKMYVGGVPTKPMKPQRLKKGGIASPKAKPKKMKKGGLASSRKK